MDTKAESQRMASGEIRHSPKLGLLNVPDALMAAVYTVAS